MRRFRLHEPGSLEEASRLLREYGDTAQPCAGGTELLLAMKLGVLPCEHLINLKRIPGLDFVRYDDATGWLHIGALATHRDVERSPVVLEHLPALAAMERTVANVRIRNVGTVAGNLCFAHPASDPGTLLLCLQAEVALQRDGQQRALPVDSFFLGAFATSRADDELVTEVRVPPLPPRSAVAFEQFRFYERSTANVAVMTCLDEGGERVSELRVAIGAVSPTPVRLGAVEAAARRVEVKRVGEAVDEVLGDALHEVEVLGGIHGSPEYLRHLVRVLLRRAVASAVASAGSQR